MHYFQMAGRASHAIRLAQERCQPGRFSEMGVGGENL